MDSTSLPGGDVFRYALSNNWSFFSRGRFTNANALVTPTATAGLVSDASNATPIVITSANHGLLTGDETFIGGVLGNTAADFGTSVSVTVIDADRFSLDGSAGNGAYLGGGAWQRISLVDKASGVAGTPVVITTTIPHRLSTGDQVFLQGLGGSYAALNNSGYYVTVLDATRFSVHGTVADGSTAKFGFYSPANGVLLKSAIGGANLSGLNAADAGFDGFLFQPFALNSVDPRLMLAGFTGVYEDADPDPANGFAGDVITNISADVPNLNGNIPAQTGLIYAMAYGGFRAGAGYTNVAVMGSTTGQLWVRGETGAAFTDVSDGDPGDLGGGTGQVWSVAVDPADWRRVYVVKGDQLWFTPDVTDLAAAGHEFRVIGGAFTDNLITLTSQLRAVAVVPSASGNVPVVGGLGGVFRLLPPSAAACPDAPWSKYGQDLPHALVRGLSYDAATDTLLAATYGRGAWAGANASATVGSAARLDVTGDGNANTLELRPDPNNPLRLIVSDGLGAPQSFETSTVMQVSFQGLGGADLIRVLTLGTPGADLQYVNFRVSVDGGGQAGDRLEIDDSTDDIGRGATFTVDTVGAGNTDTLFGPCGSVAYSGLDSLALTFGFGAADAALIRGLSVPTLVDFGFGLDTLDLSGLTDPQAVTLSAPGALGGFDGATTAPLTFRNVNVLVGTHGLSDTLFGLNADALWLFDLAGGRYNAGPGTLLFFDVENAVGGGLADRFLFWPGAGLAGNLDGGGGADTLDYSAFDQAVRTDLQTRTSAGFFGTFAGVESLIGSSSPDDALVGEDNLNVWNVTGTTRGDVDGFTFDAVENLIGGWLADLFRFQPGGVAGNIDGGLGGGNDLLDFSGLSQPQEVFLSGVTQFRGFDGFLGGNSPIGGTFRFIDSVFGSAASAGDSLTNLTGRTADWLVNGRNAGIYQDLASSNQLRYRSVEFLRGGPVAESFSIEGGTGAQITGLIDGNGGQDTLFGFNGPYRLVTLVLTPGGLSVDGLTSRYVDIERLFLFGLPIRCTIRFDQGNPVPVLGVIIRGFSRLGVLTIIGSAQKDRFTLKSGLLRVNASSPILYSGVERLDLFAGGGDDTFDARSVSYQAALVRFFGGLGNDTITLAPSTTTRFFIHGGPPARPTVPGDALFFVKAGQLIQPPVILGNGGSDGLYRFRNRMSVQFVSIERGVGGNLDLQPWNFAAPNIF
ncbi:MAG: hypothetical protein U0797_16575 [Gemmataceae bacterium]